MKQTPFYALRPLALAVSAALLLTACGDDNNDSNDTPTDTALSVAKPALPQGVGYEPFVALPEVTYPLPAVQFGSNNSDGTLKYSINDNPYPYLLRGINSIWQGTSDDYQNAASGSGPDNYLADPIVDAASWSANIAYVVKVTNNRTDDQAIRAYLDDRRGKSYSVVDGFGPLTEDYVANSGTYYAIKEPTVAQVLSNENYLGDSDDSWTFTGSETGLPLSAAVRFTNDMRYNMASTSTSGSKYIFSTPRPWRMNDQGVVEYLGNESRTCEKSDGTTTDIDFDTYATSVKLVPGLVCARRKSNSGTEQSLRKDGGYPSGHTNAGVVSSLSLAYAFPERFAEHLVRGSDLGEDRIVAGMHSPVDVIGGRIMGLISAAYMLNTSAGQESAEQAYNDLHEYFGAKASAAGMSLYDYAHRTLAANETGSFRETVNGVEMVNADLFNNNFYDDHDAIKALYEFRMTYGLPKTGTAGQPAIVPEGAELILKTRQPYLSAAQRRAVIATTEVDSGYPLLDASNGWGRINLVAAADGYGAFDGDVNVTMEAGKGGFNAKDWWRNDISGKGKLTKAGSGELVLTGANTYSGGTVLEAGALTAASASAFGSGTVFAQGGDLQIAAQGAVAVSALTVEPAATLSVAMDDDSTQVSVAGTAYVDGAALELSFASAPAAGSRFTVLSAAAVGGEFASVYAGDVAVTLEYTPTSVVARIR